MNDGFKVMVIIKYQIGINWSPVKHSNLQKSQKYSESHQESHVITGLYISLNDSIILVNKFEATKINVVLRTKNTKTNRESRRDVCKVCDSTTNN